jgi:cytochrome c
MKASAVNRSVGSSYRCRAAGFLLLLGLVPGAMNAVTAARAEGDPVRGQTVYARCAACHSLGYNRTGPLHCGIIGRRAGSVDGFTYSQAMRESNIVWSTGTLDTFLKSPMSMVPGTTMGYVGIPDENDRSDLIAYLEQAGRSADTCGSHLGHKSR